MRKLIMTSLFIATFLTVIITTSCGGANMAPNLDNQAAVTSPASGDSPASPLRGTSPHLEPWSMSVGDIQTELNLFSGDLQTKYNGFRDKWVPASTITEGAWVNFPVLPNSVQNVSDLANYLFWDPGTFGFHSGYIVTLECKHERDYYP